MTRGVDISVSDDDVYASNGFRSAENSSFGNMLLQNVGVSWSLPKVLERYFESSAFSSLIFATFMESHVSASKETDKINSTLPAALHRVSSVL